MQQYHVIGDIHLTGGATARISPEDADLADFVWRLHSAGYAVRSVTDPTDGRRLYVYLHRTILERVLGRPLAPGEEVDHVDGQPLNNQRDNLRLATHAQNLKNMKMHADNATGFKGVSFNKRTGLWVAQIRVNGKNKGLGYFHSPEAASAAYQCAATEQFGEWQRRTTL